MSTVPPSSLRITMTPAARRVVDAAARLFYARGIHAVGVDLIAAEAGVTKKTIYDRFGSKEQIVVEYLADRDEQWRAFLAGRLDETPPEPAAGVLAVFDASRDWMRANSPRGCSMVNAHAEISDPAHLAYPLITGQKEWMLGLFTELGGSAELGRTLMLLHEGALVAHGLGTFTDPLGHAREQARLLLDGAASATPGRSSPRRE